MALLIWPMAFTSLYSRAYCALSRGGGGFTVQLDPVKAGHDVGLSCLAQPAVGLLASVTCKERDEQIALTVPRRDDRQGCLTV